MKNFAPLRDPADQADGLRRLFAASRLRIVPVLSNPQVRSSAALLDALCASFVQQGMNTLLVDAGERAPAAPDMAAVALNEAVEQLSPSMSYLAARGLPLRYLDAHGNAAPFLDALAQAAPYAQVAVVHASAAELSRVVNGRDVRPLLLADTELPSVTHAYGSMKWMAQRTGLMVYALLIGCAPQLRMAHRIAAQMASCGDTFLSTVVSDWAALDTRQGPHAPLPERVHALARHLAHRDLPVTSLPAQPTAARRRAPHAHV